jgi:hypothetical protein
MVIMIHKAAGDWDAVGYHISFVERAGTSCSLSEEE